MIKGTTRTKVYKEAEERCELIVIGVVKATASQKEESGYVVYSLKTKEKNILDKSKLERCIQFKTVENMQIQDGVVINNECAISRLPVYRDLKTIIHQAGYIILGEIFENNKITGYKVLTPELKELIVSEKVLIDAQDTHNCHLVNAKVVPKDGVKFLSAIKGTFKRIDCKVIVDTKDKAEVKKAASKSTAEMDAEKAEYYKIHLKKLMVRYMNNVIGSGCIFESDKKQYIKDYKIFLKDYGYVAYPALKCLDKVEKDSNIVFIVILLTLVEQKKSTSYDSTSSIYLMQELEDNCFKPKSAPILASTFDKLTPFSAANADYKKVLDFLTYRDRIIKGDFSSKKLVEENLVTLSSLILRKIAARFAHSKNKDIIKSDMDKILKKQEKEALKYNTDTIPYDTEEGLNTFGLTAVKDKVGTDYRSVVYFETKLRWVFDGIQEFDNERVFDAVNCYGDIRILDLIKKSLSCRGYASRSMTDNVSFLTFMLCVFNKPLYDVVISKICKYSGFNESVVVFDIDSGFDAKLAEILKYNTTKNDLIFYHSGLRFNQELDLVCCGSWSTCARGSLRSVPSELNDLYVELHGSRDKYNCIEIDYEFAD